MESAVNTDGPYGWPWPSPPSCRRAVGADWPLSVDSGQPKKYVFLRIPLFSPFPYPRRQRQRIIRRSPLPLTAEWRPPRRESVIAHQPTRITPFAAVVDVDSSQVATAPVAGQHHYRWSRAGVDRIRGRAARGMAASSASRGLLLPNGRQARPSNPASGRTARSRDRSNVIPASCFQDPLAASTAPCIEAHQYSRETFALFMGKPAAIVYHFHYSGVIYRGRMRQYAEYRCRE